MTRPGSGTVSLQRVSKHYGPIEAVRDVSFDLDGGQAIALVGHNGAGKTTLMKLMLGLVRPSAGSLRVLGETPSDSAFAIRQRIGYLPENVSLNTQLTGLETLCFYARLKRQPAGAARELLERVGLTEAARRRIATYSKGMRQRLGLAQALLGDPVILLLDEPTTGLDPELRQRFYEIVGEMRGRGATVLLSSHALAELEGRVDRVIIMNHGTLVADGSIDALRRAARLPTRIRLKLATGGTQVLDRLGPVSAWRPIDGEVMEVEASPHAKLDLLRRALNGGSEHLEDLDVLPPTLDDIYAHFTRSGGTGVGEAGP